MTDNGQTKDLAWQLEELEKLVHDRFIQKNENVKGAFTSGDFVEWRLRNIFGPQNISVELRDGPRVVTISESQAYTQALIRLSVRFADGTETYQDAVGVWPLAATKAREGGTLENTAPERYETVLKACQTDGIKAAAERLGTCFRPLSDLALKAFVVEREYRQKHPRQPGQTESEKEALFGTGNKSLQDPPPAGPEWPTETFEAGVPEEEQPATAKPGKAPIAKKGTPSGNGNIKAPKINTANWKAACDRLAAEEPYYRNKDGKANAYHIAGSAAKSGYTEINDANLDEAMAELRRRVREEKKLASITPEGYEKG